MTDSTSSLTQLQKLIRSLRKQEIEQIQQVHGDALKQIASIARDNNLSIESVQIAMSIRAPKEERQQRIARKGKKKRDDTNSEITTFNEVAQ